MAKFINKVEGLSKKQALEKQESKKRRNKHILLGLYLLQSVLTIAYVINKR